MNELRRLVKWQIERTGEVILWGQGTIYVDVEGFQEEGYQLHILEDDVDPYGPPARFFAIVEPEGYPDPARSDIRGFAIGKLERKMVPEVTPDITGVELSPAEQFNGRLMVGPPRVQ